MLRRSIVAISLVAAAVPALAAGAGAEVPLGNLVASPNPATVGDVVLVGNVDEVNSTCQGGVVDWTVYDPSLAEADSGTATPDVDGNWSISFQATAAGTWMVSAECNVVEGLQGAPSSQPYFPYGDLTVLVQAAGTTVPTTATTASSTTTSTAAAAATVTPAFTG